MNEDTMPQQAERPIDEWLTPGTELGRHRVVGKLSEGAHAILYMGEHVQTRAEVAIKVQRKAFSRDPEMLARFDREAIVMGRLAGARTIVHVHDAGALPDGRRYLVMEFVRGRELSTLLMGSTRRGVPLEIDRVVSIASDLAAALRDVHGKNVVHRDLKPSNVMIVREPDGRETAKLVDFGVSGDRDQSAGTGDLTMTGTVIGTPEYMGPEQAVGLPAAPTMDLFALGVLMFEMTTGARPPRAALVGGTVPRASSLRSGVPKGLDELIRDLLAPDPRRRPEDAIAVLTRLKGVSEELRGKSGPNAWAEGRPVRAAGAIQLAGAADAAYELAANAADVERERRQTQPERVPAEDRSARAAGRGGRSRIAIAAAAFAVALAIGVGIVVAMPVGDRTLAGAPEPAAVPELGAMAADVGPASADPKEARLREPSTIEASPSETPTPAATASSPSAEPGDDDRVEAEADEGADASEPVPSTPSKLKPAARTKPLPSAPSKPPVAETGCADERTLAQQASDTLKWKAVLEHTRKAACWPDARARLRLRVEALAELGRFENCAREGGSSEDPTVKRIVELCTKRIDAG